jgi:alkylmercury lyase
MTTDKIDQLAEELGLFNNRQTQLFKPLLLLLSIGEPVSVEQLARATGRTREELVRMLETSPSTEFDNQGRVVGAGLTLNPTPHQFEINGRTLYTWCALDTLVFPVVLNQAARVASPTPGTDTLVRLIVTPDDVEAISPPTAVVSMVKRAADPDVRRVFCSYVHFFSSPDGAEPWLEQHPEARLLSVADAFALAQRIAACL